MEMVIQAIINGLLMGSIYALVAIGLTIIWGLMEMINFGHGEFLMIGMFAAWWFSSQMGIEPLILMFPVALVMYGGGVLTYNGLMKRVQRGPIFTQIFATIGLLFVLQNGAVAMFTSDHRFVANTFLINLSGAALQVGGVRLGVPLALAALIALGFFAALYLLIERTELGAALQATSENRDAAVLTGVKPERMFALAWGMGAALVAVAGVILANFYSISPVVGLPFTLIAYCIVAFGGFGSVLGTLVAALLVGVIQSVGMLYLPPAFRDATIFGSFIIMVLLRPQGLFGRF